MAMNTQPDQFFSAEQQHRLRELMDRWRKARDSGIALSLDEQSQLDELIRMEVEAAGQRAAYVIGSRLDNTDGAMGASPVLPNPR
jgi:hypothetical protein